MSGERETGMRIMPACAARSPEVRASSARTLVDALVARGDEVIVVDDLSFGKREHVNSAAAFIKADIRDGLDLEGIDVVFHLAAQTDVATSVAKPTGGRLRQRGRDDPGAEAARAGGAQVVFTSTGGAIYGECDVPAAEDGARKPLSPYGIAKLCAEEYLQGWNRMHGSTHTSCDSGTSTGRASRRASKAASSRSSSAGCSAASRR